MSVETWIVLVIGVVTVWSQFRTAKLGRDVATQQLDASAKQAQASEAALRSELQAVLVIARGSFGPEQAVLEVYNGGRYAAIDLRLDCVDAQSRSLGTGSTPIVEAGQRRDITIPLGSAERRDAFAKCRQVVAKWGDGTGARDVPITLLRVD